MVHETQLRRERYPFRLDGSAAAGSAGAAARVGAVRGRVGSGGGSPGSGPARSPAADEPARGRTGGGAGRGADAGAGGAVPVRQASSQLLRSDSPRVLQWWTAATGGDQQARQSVRARPAGPGRARGGATRFRTAPAVPEAGATEE